MSIRTHNVGTLYMMFTRRYDEAIELPDAVWSLNRIPRSLSHFRGGLRGAAPLY
jgi:hypothetical protein